MLTIHEILEFFNYNGEKQMIYHKFYIIYASFNAMTMMHIYVMQLQYGNYVLAE